MKTTTNITMCRLLALPTLLGLSSLATGLTPMSDGEMSSVSGQDGLTIRAEIGSPDIQELTWAADNPDPAAGAPLSSVGPSVTFANLAIQNTDGSTPYSGDPFVIDNQIDAQGGTNPLPFLNTTVTMPFFRFFIGDFVHSGIGTSNGQMALDTGLTLSYVGPLLADTTDSGLTSLSLDMQPSRLFYRQGGAGAPEWGLNNLEFDFSVANANLNADTTGLILDAPSATVKLVSDFTYDPNGTSPFAITDADRPTLTSGWSGTLDNFFTRIAGGGSWTGDDSDITSNRSQGLNLALRWDFGSDFQWVLGESDDPAQAPRLGSTILFDTWQPMDSTVSAFNFPNVTLDPIAGGQAPGGLCWLGLSNLASCTDGGTLVDVPLDSTGGLALLIRDGHLGAFSTGVTVRDDVNGDGEYANNGTAGDPGNDEIWSKNWGLIYTLGDVDGNIYLYPGGGNADTHTAGATVPGLRADVALKIQSRARDSGDMDNDGDTTEIVGPSLSADDAYTQFTRGTHFMIADTDTNLAVGLHSADLLFLADDLYLSMLDTGMNLNSALARIQFLARFGGGPFPDLSSNPVKVLDINANLEFTNFDLTLNGSPSCASPPCETHLRYAGNFELADLDNAIAHTNSTDDTVDDGSFISISEPGQPDVDLRLSRIKGTLAVRNGKLDLESTADNSDSDPAKLLIEQDLLIGSTAGGNALEIGRVEFGNRNLGTVVVPSGKWHSRVGFKCQTTGGTCN